MKGSICEEDIIIPTVYAPNNTFQNTLSKNWYNWKEREIHDYGQRL